MFGETQATAANAIVAAWKRGVRHPIQLADIAIKTVERKVESFLETRLTMEYRGVKHTVVQGIERGIRKWSASVEGLVVIGKEQTTKGQFAEIQLSRAPARIVFTRHSLTAMKKTVSSASVALQSEARTLPP